jgi:hypothetical protein
MTTAKRTIVARVCLIGLLPLASACASATAKARTDPTPLAIPEPPPRVVDPLPEVDELPAEPIRREPVAAMPSRPSRPTRENGGAPKTDPKTEPAKSPEPVATEAPPTAPPAPPSLRAELRTPETVDEAGAERQVRDTVDRAGRLLAKVDYRSLRREGRQQYDTSKRFIEQAEEAMRARNYVAAQYLADMAETIAMGLTGR